jgi:hypothetical protein
LAVAIEHLRAERLALAANGLQVFKELRLHHVGSGLELPLLGIGWVGFHDRRGKHDGCIEDHRGINFRDARVRSCSFWAAECIPPMALPIMFMSRVVQVRLSISSAFLGRLFNTAHVHLMHFVNLRPISQGGTIGARDTEQRCLGLLAIPANFIGLILH